MTQLYVKLGMVFAISLVWINPAFAYLDPGTGSIVLQAVIGTLAAAGVAFAAARQHISDFFSRLFKRNGKRDEDES